MEFLLCVCWLDKVVLLVHCCVLQISGIQGTPLHPVPCSTLQCLAISATDVDHIDTYPAGAVVNSQRSGGRMMPAKVLGPSEGGADSRTITYERSGTVVTHDCAPFSTAVHCPYANNPTTHLSSLGPQPVREKAACQNSLPQGLEPPVTPPAKPAPKCCQTSCQTLSQ
jgi:hypothetical protein